MGAETKIEWCDATFNPWIGCTKVSAACDHCYAETLAKRYGWAKWGPGEARRMASPSMWKNPKKWDKAAADAGIRRRVFCASLADVFDAEVDDEWRILLFEKILSTPSLDWLLLTKRPQVAKKWFDAVPAPRNVWLGTTVEDQKMADLRIPILLSIDVRVRFMSCEPLLGRIFAPRYGVHWVIAGGESGPGARPMHPDWARSLRDQCDDASVPFFFKQWGEWAPVPGSPRMVRRRDCFLAPDGRSDILGPSLSTDLEDVGTPVRRVGKKAAGAMLDGREHREFPA